VIVSDNVLIATIGAIATVMVSCVNAAFAWNANTRAKRNEQHLLDTKADVVKLVVQTDGMSERLCKITGESEHAKGMLEGKRDILEGEDGVPDFTCKFDKTETCKFEKPETCKFEKPE
jgi:hypothetical protein